MTINKMKSINAKQVEALISLESAFLNSKEDETEIRNKLTDIYSVKLTRVWLSFSIQTGIRCGSTSSTKSSSLPPLTVRQLRFIFHKGAMLYIILWVDLRIIKSPEKYSTQIPRKNSISFSKRLQNLLQFPNKK